MTSMTLRQCEPRFTFDGGSCVACVHCSEAFAEPAVVAPFPLSPSDMLPNLVDTNDVVLAEIAAVLHFDELERLRAVILKLVRGSEWDEDVLVPAEMPDGLVDRHGGGAAHDHPMFRPETMLLQEKAPFGRDDHALHLEAFASIAPDDPSVAGLREHAAVGVASRSDLVRDFQDTAEAILDAVHQPDGDQGIFNRLMSSATSAMSF